jgi:hypothetical protein
MRLVRELSRPIAQISKDLVVTQVPYWTVLMRQVRWRCRLTRSQRHPRRLPISDSDAAGGG